ncbi:MAG: site-2 protease family protein [Proteobacteria bacterium]|nr:site-2 protease family protein [Pseudomonadota bacterium]
MDHFDSKIIELQEKDGEFRFIEPKKKIPWLNIFLFVLTFFTTTFAGATFNIKDPSEGLNFFSGLPFSISLLTILLFHEFGHYLMSKKHNVPASLPYFIPAPSFIGTFGAIIKMRSVITDKKSLIDIGATGPIAGFIVSIPLLIYGIANSTMSEIKSSSGIILGDSLLLKFLTYTIWGKLPENLDLILHPVAFAGWIGTFVTAMNLIPVGQLDGGHILYALFPKLYRKLSFPLILGLFLIGYLGWEGWIFWGFLLLILGRNHPPVIDEEEKLPLSKKIVGLIALIIFVITFVPVPFKMP